VQAVFYNRTLATPARINHAFALSRRRPHARTLLELAHDLGTIRGVSAGWRTPLLARMRELDIPTLVVWGDRDHILPFSHLAAAQAALPGIETHVFAKTGHMPQIEKGDEFASVLTDFLSRRVASTASA
jgi:pimeloyl-ACP methyl ester carboxylesterase